jgi:glucokinase
MKRWVIGADLGGTLIRAIRTDLEGRKVARAETATQAWEAPAAILDRIFAMIQQTSAGVDPDDIAGIAIGAPGPIDDQGRLHDPPNLPTMKEVSLSEEIQACFRIPSFAGNDANLAALGEHRFGAGQGVPDLIYMTIGTGIGGGIISQGQLLLGAHGFAAEIGHQTLDPAGPVCGCGQPGHLEAFASGPNIARMARERLRSGASSAIDQYFEAGELTGRSVTLAAQAGDGLALEVLERAAFYVGLGLVNLIHILDPLRILLGGGVTAAGELLFGPIRQTVNDRVMSPVYRGVEIQPAALGKDVGLLGAVAWVLEQLELAGTARSPA